MGFAAGLSFRHYGLLYGYHGLLCEYLECMVLFILAKSKIKEKIGLSPRAPCRRIK
jgi:hypothetical protein